MIGYYALVDLLLAFIPFIVIKDLKIKRRRKITLIAVLSLGILYVYSLGSSKDMLFTVHCSAAVCAGIKTPKLLSESSRTDFTCK